MIYTLVGTSLATQESVPAAFAVLAAEPADPWQACLLAASLGGDCDTIAAMAGAIAGACHGVTAFPPERDRRHRRPGPRTRRARRRPVHTPGGPVKRLVFAGEAIVDVLMRVPALPERGGDMLSESAAVEVGGGFNIMAAAVRQGLPVIYAGGHGTGPWGDKVRAALAAEDIGLLRAPDPDRDTGFDVALVEADGERTFITHLGAESLREPGAWDLVRVRSGRRRLRVRLRPGPARLRSRSSAPGPPAFRPRSCCSRTRARWSRTIPAAVLDPVLARCDWWSCNAREAVLLTGSQRPGRGGPPPGQPDQPGGRRSSGPARTAACWRSGAGPARTMARP